MGEEFKVTEREDFVYGEGLDNMMQYYRGIQKVLEDLDFDRIVEDRSEHWEYLPFKQSISAYKWKDPFTKIRIKVKARVKLPFKGRRTSEDLYKGRFIVSAYVIHETYPRWEFFEPKSWYEHSPLYKPIRMFLSKFFFKKEWEKYKEEAEELATEVISRIRKLEGSMPAIGRSKREWVEPDFRED
ncbi:MAG: hypothetical protein SVV03_05925 [Candidatus Nanohaloarchaea archaeon]|nr:hypothetical protein [Candidatus Nanohaloarchaea archaeon]